MSENVKYVDNIVTVDNTPIFDQLLKEFAARGKHYESLIAGGAINLRPARLEGVRAPYAVADELPEVEMVQQTDEAVNAAAKPALPVRPVVKTLRQQFEKESVTTEMIGIAGIMDRLKNDMEIDPATIDIEAVYTEPVEIDQEDLQRLLNGAMSINTLRNKYYTPIQAENMTATPIWGADEE